MKKSVPTDDQIAQALTWSKGSARGAARILGCTAARIAKYARQRMVTTPVTDATPCHPLTEGELMSLRMLEEMFAEELAS